MVVLDHYLRRALGHPGQFYVFFLEFSMVLATERRLFLHFFENLKSEPQLSSSPLS